MLDIVSTKKIIDNIMVFRFILSLHKDILSLLSFKIYYFFKNLERRLINLIDIRYLHQQYFNITCFMSVL